MAVTTTNLGVITAYGDAVAAGYTGTKAEWQALMASYATVGQQAVDAKNAAVSAKDTAVAKATEATTAAATANTAKDTATSKATEATTAANTATNKANEASASAQSIAQSAAQIQENTDSIDQLKSELAVTSSYDITWSQGGINSSGTAVSRTNRIRTDYIVIENDSISVEIPSGFKYAIHAYTASKTRIGYIPNGSDIMTDRKATYKVSDSYANAVYFRMWVAYADDSDILPAEGSNVTVAPYESVIESLKSRVLKSVRILGVGNSYTRDSIRWLCKILKESGYENVIVGHGYLGASTLAEQYASLDSSDSNHSAFEYWKYSNNKNAVKTSGKTLDEIFTDEPWDIVVFQQQSDESGQYSSYVSLSFDINDFITYISGKVSNADLKFAIMMPWSHADGYTSTKFAEYYNSDPRAMLDAIKTVIPQVADHMSQCDYVVNAGEAIDLGRQNSYLNALGDQMLRTDKNHLYYGIPSYMVGLVYALTLCDVNINNVMWYPTATDEGQTGITTSGYLAYLAKQCAFTAVNGYALADDISELKEDLTQVSGDVDKYEPLISKNLFDYSTRIDDAQLSADMDAPTAYTGRSVSAPILINNTTSSYTTLTFNKQIEIIAYYNEQGTRLGQYDYNSWTSVDGGYTREITTNKNPVYICIQWVSNPSSQIGTYIDASDLMLTYDAGHSSSGVKPFLPYDLNAPAFLGNRIGLYTEIPKYRQLDSCFFIGNNAGKSNREVAYGDGDNGRWNTGIGVSAMEKNTDGDHCTAIGYRALYNNTTGNGNTGLGEDTLHNNTSGGGNTAVGVHVLQNNTTGNSNTAVGESTLIGNTTGFYNTAIGDFAGSHGVNITTDDRLTLIGNKAGKNTESIISNSTAIGSGAKVTKSNQVVLGNSSVEEFVIGNKKMVFNIDGTVTWESIS